MLKTGERSHTFKSLDAAAKSALKIRDYEIEKDRYVILSDVHKGDGKPISDDFLQNSEIYINTLRYYLDNGYRLILNGDIEECWKSKYSAIIEAHESTAFAMEREYAALGESHYMRIYGNHDDDWADPQKVKRHLQPVLGDIRVHSGILLGDRIFITHGHQGDPNADRRAWFSRQIVRHGWRHVQRTTKWKLSFAADNNLILCNRARQLQDWAKHNRMLMIAGHTHRPVFRPLSKLYLLRGVHEWLEHLLQNTTDANMCRLLPVVIEQINQVIQAFDDDKAEETNTAIDNVPYYLNDGSCVHTNGITSLEIDRGEMRLVRWDNDAKNTAADTSNLAAYHLARKVYQTGDLGEILSKLNILASLPMEKNVAGGFVMPPALQEMGVLTGLANLMLP